MQPTLDTTPWQVTEPEIMDTDKYLSSANAPDIEEDARLCIASGARSMILNCSNLSYATGAGLRAFLNIARMMEAAGGKVQVQGLRGQPREIFYACGLDTMISSNDAAQPLSIVQAV
jgi:anti-anti-sigma factor